MSNNEIEVLESNLPPGDSEKSAAEIRLNAVIRKLLEISQGSGNDLGGNVLSNRQCLLVEYSDSAVIETVNDGVEYRFWFRKESKQYYVDAVEVDADGMDVDYLKWHGDEDAILSRLENCLSGKKVFDGLGQVAWEFAN